MGNELLYVKLRYKEPKGQTSKLFSHTVLDGSRLPTEDFRFATAVAEFGMILRESEYRGSSSLTEVLKRARGALGADPGGDRRDFVTMVEQFQAIGQASDKGPRPGASGGGK
jgi:Ca-activated chloride channel family protein